MADPVVEVTPDNLLRIRTQITRVRALHQDLMVKVGRGELIEARRLEKVFADLGHRWRDQMLTAPARHAAIIAAELKLDPAALAAGFETVMRALLTDIAARALAEENAPEAR